MMSLRLVDAYLLSAEDLPLPVGAPRRQDDPRYGLVQVEPLRLRVDAAGDRDRLQEAEAGGLERVELRAGLERRLAQLGRELSAIEDADPDPRRRAQCAGRHRDDEPAVGAPRRLGGDDDRSAPPPALPAASAAAEPSRRTTTAARFARVISNDSSAGRCVSRPASALFAVHSAVVLTCGNGSGGTGTSSALQIGGQPSSGCHSTRRSAGNAARTSRLFRSYAAIAVAASSHRSPIRARRSSWKRASQSAVLGKVVLASDFEDGPVCAAPPRGRIVALRQHDDRIGIRVGELAPEGGCRPVDRGDVARRGTRSSRACRRAARCARPARGRGSRTPRPCGSSARREAARGRA